MNWEAIGAIGEILGAIAVFGSLLYLAIQIKAQNKESRLGAIREFTDSYNQVTDSISADPDMASMWVKASSQGLDQLDEIELIRFSSLLQKITRMWENSYYQHKDGRLDDRLWNSFNTQLSEVSSMQAYNTWWKQRAHYFSEEFQRFVETNETREYRLMSSSTVDDT